MSKCGVITPERFEAAEQELIKLSGTQVECFRVYLEESLMGPSIFGLKSGDPSKPILVLIHGYMGASIIFYKLFKDLTEHYLVYCLDLLGFGRSSRPEFVVKGQKEAESFFIKPIEIFRTQLNISKMVLAGHSFGGYVAGCYTEQYPQHVEKLILISAIGIPKAPCEDRKELLKKLPWKMRTITKIAKFFLKKDITPPSLLRKLGPLGGWFMKRSLRRRWKKIPEEELSLLEVYLRQVNLYPGSGEYALKELFGDGGFANQPLCERITSTPTIFIYGDRDWMDPVGAGMNKLHNSAKVICEFISDSGHHMYFDNPIELTTKIINCLRNLDEPSPDVMEDERNEIERDYLDEAERRNFNEEIKVENS